MKKEKIMFIFSLIIMLFSGAVSIFAVTCLYNSEDVSYDNSNSGLTSTNVQASLDELYGHCTDYNNIDARLTAVENNMISLDDVYPVGSIYITVTEDTVAKVQAKFGGTWEAFGQGRTLVGMGSNGTTNYSTVAATGGQETINLAHSHTVDSHSHTMAHTHNYGVGFAGYYGTTNAENKMYLYNGSWVQKSTSVITSTLSINYNSNLASGSTTGNNQVTGATSATSGSSAANTGNASPGTNSKLSATQSIMQPYITVYMYKRTA